MKKEVLLEKEKARFVGPFSSKWLVKKAKDHAVFAAKAFRSCGEREFAGQTTGCAAVTIPLSGPLIVPLTKVRRPSRRVSVESRRRAILPRHVKVQDQKCSWC